MAQGLSEFLPYGAHYIDDADRQAVVDVLKSDRLTCGPLVEKFEKTLADMVGAKYAASCANGTAGLHLACLAAGVQPGDNVIVPTITFLASANAPRWCGADIIFCDVNPKTGLMEPAHFEEAIARAGGKAKAVIPVHLAGHVCDMKSISAIAKKHGIIVIEDACHALGTDYKDSPVGDCAYSDMTMFSFHPVKNIGMGEGGVITTNNPECFDRMVHLRGHGMERDPALFANKDIAFDSQGQPNPWYYEMPEIGLNYRLTDIQCALGLSQLQKLAAFKKKRADLRALYCDLLKGMEDIVIPMPIAADSNACWHIFVVHIDFGHLNIEKSELMRQLAAQNVGSQVHYTPVHLQPYYRQQGQPAFPSAMQYYASTLTLPLHVNMSEQDVYAVVEIFREIMVQNRKMQDAAA